MAELPYWPSVSYLAKITIHKRLLLEKCEHFVKSANRNRCWLATANGIQLLTIPISGGRSHKQLYSETQTDNRLPWQRQHWQALSSAYGKSPFFEYYAQELVEMYQATPPSLWSFNERILRWLVLKLQLSVEIECTHLFEKSPACRDNRSYGGPHRKNILPYYQVFDNKHGFCSDMASFDLLFNLGPNQARAYLTKLALLQG